MAQIVENTDENSKTFQKQGDPCTSENEKDDSFKDKEESDCSENNLDNPLLRLLPEKMKTALLVLSHLAITAFSYPSQTQPPLISFDKGGVGVNFLGYHASAGLGGLLTGNTADGGLFAKAGTPHGQQAGAGLGGTVSEGRAAGGLYAGATAGGGVSAGAGLHGVSGEGGSAGSLYSGASAGGKTYSSTKYGGNVNKEVEVINEKVIETPAPAPAVIPEPAPAASRSSAGISGGLYISKSINAAPAPAPAIRQVEQVTEEEAPAPQKTYIERTVIPNYVEKTIQVPSYEERIVRVPTVIEKRVKVPAPPTIIEKEVPVPEAPPQPQVQVQKIKTVYRPAVRKHWRKYGAGAVSVNPSVVSTSVVEKPAAADINSSFYVEKRYNGQLINDIFNIPISTLQAVNRLVGGIGGGVSGSFTASKHYGTY